MLYDSKKEEIERRLRRHSCGIMTKIGFEVVQIVVFWVVPR